MPPTPERVQEFLTLAALDPGTVLGEVAVGRAITAEKAAINAVIAGLLPVYFPVVVAAIQALTDDGFCLHGSMASTGGAAPLLIVNGPIRQQIALTPAATSLAPARRANAAIGARSGWCC